MKKFISVFTGLIAGFIAVLILAQLFKGAIAGILLSESINYNFEGLFLDISFKLSEQNSFFTYLIIFISPFVASIIFIELTSYLLKKINNNNTRAALIVFKIINIGYIIYSIVVGVIEVAFKTSAESNWLRLFEFSDYSYNQKLIFLLLALIILVMYVNFSAKRMRVFIPMIKEQKDLRK